MRHEAEGMRHEAGENSSFTQHSALSTQHWSHMNFFFYLVTTLFIIVCIFLILLVLIQKGRGGGLVSAFGGMGGNTAFGSKTGDVLTWTTSVVFGVFLLLAIILNLIANHKQDLYNQADTTQSTPMIPAGQ